MTALSNLIHVGKIGRDFYFLRKLAPQQFSWFQQTSKGNETSLNLVAHSIEEALRLASRSWAPEGFRSLHCGFRYTLPERDEHGMNALFYQMVASYNSSNGVYFDDELGGNCIVHFASLEARDFMYQMQVAESK